MLKTECFNGEFCSSTFKDYSNWLKGHQDIEILFVNTIIASNNYYLIIVTYQTKELENPASNNM